ncbi:hypothetical protein AYJ54_43435 [Bradyrhizobium centrolobii]|uniref:Uncharacterized protein n=1 Tax=Bradyrhizobium centrolobii TaxID=1505087 RepID=A0A176Z2W7_9BRAD|nr:hypothetical protein [Bradyrhizobium centrolobii]OAF13585.1 hypothetical protein AYJ54_43435 [Bradyrhizobium centrolobii]
MNDGASCSHFPYIYRWTNEGRQGQRCRVLAVGTMYACLVEFPDGFKMVSTVNALREDTAVASNTGVIRDREIGASWRSGEIGNQLDCRDHD